MASCVTYYWLSQYSHTNNIVRVKAKVGFLDSELSFQHGQLVGMIVEESLRCYVHVHLLLAWISVTHYTHRWSYRQ